MPAIHRLILRDSPLLLSMPHCGTAIPDALRPKMTEAALKVADTDWYLPQLYDFAPSLGLSTLIPIYSRYVVDLNRDPDGHSLYPGASTTELCPLSTFAEAPIYRDGAEPDADDVELRKSQYWHPYHAAIRSALDYLIARHGYAILFEAHSIASHVPRFFAGQLTDFNFGSQDGRTLPAEVMEALCARVAQDGRYTWVANGRFKGGYITRQYAAPTAIEPVYTVQLELSQAVYMLEDGQYQCDESRIATVMPLLRQIIETLLAGLAKHQAEMHAGVQR